MWFLNWLCLCVCFKVRPWKGNYSHQGRFQGGTGEYGPPPLNIQSSSKHPFDYHSPSLLIPLFLFGAHDKKTETALDSHERILGPIYNHCLHNIGIITVQPPPPPPYKTMLPLITVLCSPYNLLNNSFIPP